MLLLKLKKHTMTRLRSKNKLQQLKLKVVETAKALETAKDELATAKSNLANLQQVRAQRESELKDAKAKLVCSRRRS